MEPYINYYKQITLKFDHVNLKSLNQLAIQ